MENKRTVSSTVLAKVLDDIGVNKETIQLRRTTWLAIESLQTIDNKVKYNDDEVYNFGSQSESTTTDGMNSDIDVLNCSKHWPVILDFVDRELYPTYLFVKRDMSSPPQRCFLQVVLHDKSELSTDLGRQGFAVDKQDRVFLKKTLHEMVLGMNSEIRGVEIRKHGPSRSTIDDVDMVLAFHCAKLPEECQFNFRRPRPGHWPRPEVLATLKDSGVFLITTEHVENMVHWDPYHREGKLAIRTFDESHVLYWRISTNLMERLLVFDLTTAQIKAFVILKMIKKEFCKPIVGDRLSTFHFKTALLYSVESLPPGIWKDENLVQCVKLCLTLLRRWLKMHYCPHFTTSNVNLFAGKLRSYEFPVLIEKITAMIRSDLSCLFDVKMDDLGDRILTDTRRCVNGQPRPDLVNAKDLVTGKSFKNLIGHLCVYNCLVEEFQTVNTSNVIDSHEQYVRKLEKIGEISTENIRSAVSIVLPFHYSIQATMKASLCINQMDELPDEVFKLYAKSLTSDVTSSRLKLASTYFSLRRFPEAEGILKEVEALVSNKVLPYSPFKESTFSSEFSRKRTDFQDILQNVIALCTIFHRHELHCVPRQLVSEFYRTVTEKDAGCRHPSHGSFWMDLAVVDSRTYMYYLQYLIYRHTGAHINKDIALKNLEDHVYSDRCISIVKTHSHFETSLNLLGHCWELEGQPSKAWHCYNLSLLLVPQNNAAHWHMFRMIGLCIYGTHLT